MICKSRSFAVCVCVLFALVAGLVPVAGEDTPIDLITQADFAYMTRHLEPDMLQAISLLESTLPDLESLSARNQSYVLNRLSQLCYEATTFVEGDTPEDGLLFEKGKAYGLQSLRLNTMFAELENQDFDQAISHVDDAMALHWTASNWGKLCGMNPIQGLLQQGKVLALFTRCVDVDPEYWGGSASSSLGSLLIMSPAALGGDKETGLAMVENSITLDPSYLSNRVVLAEYWGFTYDFLGQLTGVRDAALIERELAIVIDAEIGDWPFWNPHAKKLAERLLAQLQEMTD